MTDDKPPLKSIPGQGAGPKPWRRTALDQSEQATCPVCERLTGITTSAVVQIIKAPRRKPDGRLTGGSKAYVCAHCLGRGEIVELIRS